jgi:hypothetical protein
MDTFRTPLFTVQCRSSEIYTKCTFDMVRGKGEIMMMNTKCALCSAKQILLKKITFEKYTASSTHDA